MEDERIIELYFKRDERAILHTDEKYGKYCHRIANNVLHDTHDSEECVNDTYMRAWSSIPPTVPRIFSAFLGKITRNLALDRIRISSAAKRGYAESLDELGELIGTSEIDAELESREIAEAISDFLRKESDLARRIFVQRYFFCEDLADIAKRYGIGYAKAGSLLFRTRKRLAEYLKRKGILL